jgi:hypothetical protein
MHFEERLSELEERFRSVRSRYAQHRQRVDAIAASWEWSALPRYEIEPFYFELGECRRGRVMPKTPAKVAGRHQYAISGLGELVAERHHVEFPGQYYERFFTATGNDIFSDLYSYEPEKPVVNTQRLIHEGNDFICFQSRARYGRSQHVYRVRDGRIVAFTSAHHRDGGRPSIRGEYAVDYVTESLIKIWQTSTGHRRLAYEGPMIANAAIQPTATGKLVASIQIQ